jgi:hypothetical protein
MRRARYGLRPVADGQLGMVPDPNGAQSRWLGLGHQSRPQVLGPGNTLEQAKIAVAAQLEHFPRCEIRPFTENEGSEILISFQDPRRRGERCHARGSDPAGTCILDVYRSTMRRAEIPKVGGQAHAREG